jgi:hypothetical protein
VRKEEEELEATRQMRAQEKEREDHQKFLEEAKEQIEKGDHFSDQLQSRPLYQSLVAPTPPPDLKPPLPQ